MLKAARGSATRFRAQLTTSLKSGHIALIEAPMPFGADREDLVLQPCRELPKIPFA